MSARIWELHARLLGPDSIRTTPEGYAEIEGLVLSEKAYLLAVRDFRPGRLVDMVRDDGPAEVTEKLVSHYRQGLDAGGRCLVLTRGGTSPVPVIRRSDEVEAPATIRR